MTRRGAAACRSVRGAWRVALALGLPSVGAGWSSVDLDPAWPAAGVTIAAGMVPAAACRAVPDGTGGVLLAWPEARKTDPASCNCRNTDDLYVQRLDAVGRKTWSRTDVAVCLWGGLWGGGETLAAFEPTVDGGAVVGWIHGDGPSGTFAQRLGPDGGLRWGPDGVTVFTDAMGYKWAGRSAVDPGGGTWFGLDASRETAVLAGRCLAGDAGFSCALPLSVPLSGTLQTLVVLPGDRPGRALIAAACSVSDGRTRLEVIPLEARPDGGIRARRAMSVAAISAGRITLIAKPDGVGGARLGWIAPSGSGFVVSVCATRPDGTSRWTRPVGPVAGPAAPFALVAGADRTLVIRQPDPGGPLTAEWLDARGRSTGRREVTGTLRAERQTILGGTPAGPLVAWLEANGGEAETLRVAALDPAGPGGATAPVEGVALLRREARITLEHLVVPAPGRAVILVHDAAGKALRAFGLRLR